MAIALAIFEVAFAAFCIWLMVRIVNRRERWAKWTAMVLVIAGLTFGSYSGIYLLMVKEHLTWGGFFKKVEPDYRSWPNPKPLTYPVFWEKFFRPVHSLDRKIRPQKCQELYLYGNRIVPSLQELRQRVLELEQKG